MFERLSARDVINKECSNSAAIVRSGNGSKVLLSSSVPDLELDDLISHFEILCAKFNANCDIMTCPRLVFDKLQHHT